jgi:hypothetical protein
MSLDVGPVVAAWWPAVAPFALMLAATFFAYACYCAISRKRRP